MEEYDLEELKKRRPINFIAILMTLIFFVFSIFLLCDL